MVERPLLQGRVLVVDDEPSIVDAVATALRYDAFMFLRVTPVYVANMSGNLIRIGMAGGRHQFRNVVAAAVALGGFIAGVAMSAARFDMHLRRHESVRPWALLFFGSALLMSRRSCPYSLGSFTMGIHAIAMRRVGQVAVSTTYGTGSIVRIGEKLALVVRRAPRPGDHRRRVSMVALTVVIASYVAGARLAASAGPAPRTCCRRQIAPVIVGLSLLAAARQALRLA